MEDECALLVARGGGSTPLFETGENAGEQLSDTLSEII